MEICEDLRQTLGMKDLYALRKETIERIFGTAKENHGFRYTQMYGKARMEMKVGLTYACMNLKKLAKIKAKRGLLETRDFFRISVLDAIYFIKENGSGAHAPEPLCLQSEVCEFSFTDFFVPCRIIYYSLIIVYINFQSTFYFL